MEPLPFTTFPIHLLPLEILDLLLSSSNPLSASLFTFSSRFYAKQFIEFRLSGDEMLVEATREGDLPLVHYLLHHHLPRISLHFSTDIKQPEIRKLIEKMRPGQRVARESPLVPVHIAASLGHVHLLKDFLFRSQFPFSNSFVLGVAAAFGREKVTLWVLAETEGDSSSFPEDLSRCRQYRSYSPEIRPFLNPLNLLFSTFLSNVMVSGGIETVRVFLKTLRPKLEAYHLVQTLGHPLPFLSLLVDSGCPLPSAFMNRALKLGTTEQIQYLGVKLNHKFDYASFLTLLSTRETPLESTLHFLLSQYTPKPEEIELLRPYNSFSVLSFLLGLPICGDKLRMESIFLRSLNSGSIEHFCWLVPHTPEPEIWAARLLKEGLKRLNLEFVQSALLLSAPHSVVTMCEAFRDPYWTPLQVQNFFRSLVRKAGVSPLKALGIQPELIRLRDNAVSHGFLLSPLEIEAFLRDPSSSSQEIWDLISCLPAKKVLPTFFPAIFSGPNFRNVTGFRGQTLLFDPSVLLFESALSALSIERLLLLLDLSLLQPTEEFGFPISSHLLPLEEKETTILRFLRSQIRHPETVLVQKKIKLKSVRVRKIRRLISFLHLSMDFPLPTSQQLETLSPEQMKVIQEKRLFD